MDANQKVALLLLIGRIVTVGFILATMRLQYRLVKINNMPELQNYRKRLLTMTSIMLAGNFVPIAIDILGIVKLGNFTTLLIYVFSNNLTAMLGAYLVWTLYRRNKDEGHGGV